jgi:hypothetical protein
MELRGAGKLLIIFFATDGTDITDYFFAMDGTEGTDYFPWKARIFF